MSGAPRLFIVRHGETDANAARVLQVPGTPLSERGQAQARRVAQRLAGEPVGAVLSSDLRRAQQTAREIARATGAPLELDALLQERSFGDLRGTPYAELGLDPFAPDFVPPGGESVADFERRAARAWRAVEALATRCDAAVVVVTHGLVCRAFAQHHLRGGDAVPGLASIGDTALRIPNCSVTIARGPAPWRTERFACTAHLADEAVAAAPA